MGSFVASTSRWWLSWVLSKWSIRLIGLLILTLVALRIDLGLVGETIAEVKPIPFLGSMALMAPFFLIKSYRWRVILQRLGIEISSRDALQLYGAGLFLGQTTPGQLGEFVRAHLLWRRGHDLIRSTSSVVVDRAVDLIALGAVAIPGLWLFVGIDVAVASAVGIVAIAAITIAVRPRRLLKTAEAGLGRWPAIQQVPRRVDELVGTVAASTQSPQATTIIALTTVVALGVNLLRFYLLLAALGIGLPVASLVLGVSLANLVALLPITIAGVGTRDAVLVLVFHQAGHGAEGAVAFSLLILLGYLVNVAWGFVAWLLETR